jgi:NADPH:quinone reductase-like Zn-dependent oxidoreductase
MTAVLEVRRDDLRTARVLEAETSLLEAGQTRFVVERFGLTANNVTYALLGDTLRYWTFFPASEEGWGRVPAWGFATAVESRSADVPEGTRVFGYVPMGRELVLEPRHVGERGFQDGSDQRAQLPAVYNGYRRAEPSDRDDAAMVLQPLFMTSVLLARSLEGAERVVVSSASSKTALGTAHLLARAGTEVVGITAATDFASGLGVYREVLSYDAIEELERRPATFVDFSGNARVRDAVHHHLGDQLEASILVGATHVDAQRPASDEQLPGPSPTFFFAPDHIGAGIDSEARAAFAELLGWSAEWLQIERREGPDAVLGAWMEAVEGNLPPTTALSLALP